MEQYEVIELNVFGDHWVTKRFETAIQARQFCDMMNTYSEDGSVYYINNLEDEWKEVARMILEEEED
jgi:hypothetical protein